MDGVASDAGDRGSGGGGDPRREWPLPSGPMTRLLFSLLRHHLPPLRGPESTVRDLWFLLRQQRYGDALLVALRHDRDWVDPAPSAAARELVYESMRAALHERLPTPDGLGVEPLPQQQNDSHHQPI